VKKADVRKQMTSPGRTSNVNKAKSGIDKTPFRGNMS